MDIVATTNSLFETTDESCLLISGIPTVLLIDPCENCHQIASFCHKNGRNWHFSSFSVMVSDNSPFISQLEVNMFHTNLQFILENNHLMYVTILFIRE